METKQIFFIFRFLNHIIIPYSSYSEQARLFFSIDTPWCSFKNTWLEKKWKINLKLISASRTMVSNETMLISPHT